MYFSTESDNSKSRLHDTAYQSDHNIDVYSMQK